MAHKQTTAKALFMSALSVLLCLSMLVGSTFAWFTDTASTGVNTIVAGNLDVKLSYKNSKVDAFTEVGKDTNVFLKDALWEPGHTEVVYLKVENAGSLALKYQLAIAVANETTGINVEGKEFILSDYIHYAVLEGKQILLSSSEAISAAVSAGSKELHMNGYGKEGTLEKGAAPVILTLIVFMPTATGNVANHKTGTTPPNIDLGINLVATQVEAEFDSFGNDYDAEAKLPNLPERFDVALTKKIENVSEPTKVETPDQKIVVDIPAQTLPETVTEVNVAVTTPPEAVKESEVTYNIEVTDQDKEAIALNQPIRVAMDIGKELVEVNVTHGLDDGTTESFTRVNTEAELVNKTYHYDPESGKLTICSDSFSPYWIQFLKHIFEQLKPSRPNDHHQIKVDKTPVTTLDYLDSDADTSKEVTLTWYQWGAPATDSAMVYEKLNEMSKEEINTTVQYLFADGTKAGLIISSGEYYDLMFTCSWQTNYQQNAANGVFANLEDRLPYAAPTLYNFTPKLMWEGATVNGHINMVPVYKDSAATQKWRMDKSLMEEAGITQEEFDAVGKTWANMTPLLQKLKDNTDLERADAPWLYDGVASLALDFDYVTWFCGGIGLQYDSDNTRLISVLETPDALDIVSTKQYWFKNGLTNADALTADAASWSPVSYGQGWDNCEQFWYNKDHGDTAIATMTPARYNTSFILGAGHAVSVNSQHIDRSLYFLQWLNLNAEARNILCYGIEGTHWNLTEEGTVQRTEEGSTKYVPGSFAQATFFTTIPEAPKTGDSWDGLLKTTLEATASPLLGFEVEDDNMANKINAVEEVWRQYERALKVGAVEGDPAAALSTALDALNTAGLQTVIEEYQSQVDAYMASK